MVSKFGKSHPFTKFYQKQLTKAPEAYAFFRKKKANFKDNVYTYYYYY